MSLESFSLSQALLLNHRQNLTTTAESAREYEVLLEGVDILIKLLKLLKSGSTEKLLRFGHLHEFKIVCQYSNAMQRLKEISESRKIATTSMQKTYCLLQFLVEEFWDKATEIRNRWLKSQLDYYEGYPNQDQIVAAQVLGSAAASNTISYPCEHILQFLEKALEDHKVLRVSEHQRIIAGLQDMERDGLQTFQSSIPVDAKDYEQLTSLLRAALDVARLLPTHHEVKTQ